MSNAKTSRIKPQTRKPIVRIVGEFSSELIVNAIVDLLTGKVDEQQESQDDGRHEAETQEVPVLPA